MKHKLLLGVLFVLFSLFSPLAFSISVPILGFSDQLKADGLRLIQTELKVLEVRTELSKLGLNWKVGEWTSYSLNLGFGKGTVKKEVTSDEGETLWLSSKIAVMGQENDVQALIRKVDGKTLKLVVNGQEREVPDMKYEILEQKEARISVPKFPNGIDCIYLKLKEKEKGTIVETWINPKEVLLDGSVKTVTAEGFFVVTIELTDFGRP